MKKIILKIFALIMIFSLAGCTGNELNNIEPNQTVTNTEANNQTDITKDLNDMNKVANQKYLEAINLPNKIECDENDIIALESTLFRRKNTWI